MVALPQDQRARPPPNRKQKQPLHYPRYMTVTPHNTAPRPAGEPPSWCPVLSCPCNMNVQNTEPLNMFSERSEHGTPRRAPPPSTVNTHSVTVNTLLHIDLRASPSALRVRQTSDSPTAVRQRNTRLPLTHNSMLSPHLIVCFNVQDNYGPPARVQTGQPCYRLS